MPVDVKGKVSYNPDSKGAAYMLDCPQLGISQDGSGDIEEDIETLRVEIEKKIMEEFHQKPRTVQITGYTLSLGFSIEGSLNKSLDDFADVKQKGDKD